MEYIFHLLIIITVYIILSVSLNLIWGYTGLLSLAHAAFYGVGAYTAALVGMKLGLGFVWATALAVIFSMFLGVVIAIITLRMAGDYFILAVLGMQMVVTDVLFNWVDMTRGPFGLYGIQRPTILSWEINTPGEYLILTGTLALLVYLLVRRLVNSPFGRVLKAIREDEVATLVLGKNVIIFKIMVFAIGGGLAALAGSLFASYFTALHPSSFTLQESILLLVIVIVGGSGSLKGSLLGVVILLLFPEALRYLRLPGAVMGPIQQITYGLLLMFFMLFRPQGLVGEYKV